MIVGRLFDGDDASNVQLAQHDLYHDALRIIADAVQARWRDAETILDVKLMTSRSLMRESGDHRVLQGSHDILAALWRLEVGLLEPVLPFDGDFLPSLMRDWLTWLRRFMAECDPALIGDLGRAVGFTNMEPGYKSEERAEARLNAILQEALARRRSIQ